jgi:hypothetical protein
LTFISADLLVAFEGLTFRSAIGAAKESKERKLNLGDRLSADARTDGRD